MKTIILPGYSPSNKDWALEIQKELSLDHKPEIVFWGHWEKSDHKFNPREEVEKLAEIIESERVNIVAKSIGTLVAALAIMRFDDLINKVILCGIPTGIFEESRGVYVEALAQFPHDKIVIFQNESDPYGRYEEVKDLVEAVTEQIEIVKTPRSDHSYPFFEEFKKFLGS